MEDIMDEAYRKGRCAGTKYWWMWFLPYSAVLISAGYYISTLS